MFQVFLLLIGVHPSVAMGLNCTAHLELPYFAELFFELNIHLAPQRKTKGSR